MARSPKKRNHTQLIPELPLQPSQPPLMRLFIICGFQGGGLADIAVIEALQRLYDHVRCQLLEGWSFETDKKATEVCDRIPTYVKLEPKGDIGALTGLAKRLRIGPGTLVFAYGGSPCQRVSKGILFQRDDTNMVGPHQEPSSLYWIWQGALSTIASTNGNRFQDIASVSEMVEPALDTWISDFEKVGAVKRIACHD